jgi:hypothetical protein
MGIKYDKMNYSDLSENLKEFCDGLQKVADKLLKEQAKTYQLEYRQGEPPAHWAHTFQGCAVALPPLCLVAISRTGLAAMGMVACLVAHQIQMTRLRPIKNTIADIAQR